MKSLPKRPEKSLKKNIKNADEKPFKVNYYSDELNDDFAEIVSEHTKLPDDYEYGKKRSALWKANSFILYYGIAYPIVTVYNKLVHGEKIKNRKVLKGYKKEGFFLYGNHTMKAADAFTPPRIIYPKKMNILVNPDAVAKPVVSDLVEKFGGIPVASSLKSMRNFSGKMKKLSEENKAVVIYPEAHIWPYYTGIRPFKDASFKYPAEENKPVFCFTRVFKKRAFRKRPKTVVYVDGPFFPKPEYTVKENQKYLRDCVYEAMKRRAKQSNEEYVKYVKERTDGDDAIRGDAKD